MPDTNPYSLEDIAASLPSMGGRELGGRLREAASKVEEDQSIVEIGCWLGSGTAHLALGVKDSGREVSIHCYDAWRCRHGEVRKAKEQGVEFAPKQDTLPWVRGKLDAFEVPIFYHKGDIATCEWSGGQIGLFVADAAKGGTQFLHILKTFGPHWVPGKTVLFMMDLHFDHRREHRRITDQRDFFDMFGDHFEIIDPCVEGTTCGVFRYTKPLDFQTSEKEFRKKKRMGLRDATDTLLSLKRLRKAVRRKFL